jgi:hypothetical protein
VTEREIEQLLRRWQRRMGLDRWRITLDLARPAARFGDGDDDYQWAELDRSNNYETATIRLHPNWRSWSEAEAQEHLVHELVHVWMRDLEEAIKVFEGRVLYDVFAVGREAFAQRLEATVELIMRQLIAIADEGA